MSACVGQLDGKGMPGEWALSIVKGYDELWGVCFVDLEKAFD